MIKKLSWSLVLIIILALMLCFFWYEREKGSISAANSFVDCKDNGFLVEESYPRKCQTPDGRVFVEDSSETVNGTNSTTSPITVNGFIDKDTIEDTLALEGKAPGTWFFEATMPLQILDGNGNELGVVPIQATADWMTTDLVPFRVALSFKPSTTVTGTLVFKKDNPSGLPEHDAEFRIPIHFKTVVVPPKPIVEEPRKGECRPTGCSGQICSDEEVVTTCEFQPEFACYKTASCERRADGTCGWIKTSALKSCLANPPQQ